MTKGEQAKKAYMEAYDEKAAKMRAKEVEVWDNFIATGFCHDINCEDCPIKLCVSDHLTSAQKVEALAQECECILEGDWNVCTPD